MEKTKGLEFDVEGFSIIELEERQEMSAASLDADTTPGDRECCCCRCGSAEK